MILPPSPQTPQTLIKLGFFHGNLEENLQLFRSDFRKGITLRGNNIKYVAYEDTPPQYLIIASHDPACQPPKHTYNFALTITSLDTTFNERILSEFCGKTGILGLRDPHSPVLRAMYEGVSLCFPVLLRGGKSALSALIAQS